MRYNATHRAPGRSVTPLGKGPSSWTSSSSDSEPSWPSCDGDGVPNNCPPLDGESSSVSDASSQEDTSSDSAALPTGGSAVAAAASSASASGLVDAAQQAIGTDYAWGGESLSGMDCSGLIHWPYQQAGVSLDGNRTADQIMTGGDRIPLSGAQPGDIVGYQTGGGYSHAGIYVGNGEIVDASGPDLIPREDRTASTLRTVWRDRSPPSPKVKSCSHLRFYWF